MNVYCVFIVKGHTLPNVVRVYTSVNLILITVADPEQQEPANISHPSLLLWKPASSISDHDRKIICCIIVYIVGQCMYMYIDTALNNRLVIVCVYLIYI